MLRFFGPKDPESMETRSEALAAFVYERLDDSVLEALSAAVEAHTGAIIQSKAHSWGRSKWLREVGIAEMQRVEEIDTVDVTTLYHDTPEAVVGLPRQYTAEWHKSIGRVIPAVQEVQDKSVINAIPFAPADVPDHLAQFQLGESSEPSPTGFPTDMSLSAARQNLEALFDKIGFGPGDN